MLLKAAGKYEDGRIAADNGYTWIAFTYSETFSATLDFRNPIAFLNPPF